MIGIIETQAVDAKAISSLEYATNLIIADDDACKKAIEYEAGLSALIKEIDGTFDPHIRKAHDVHKSLVAEKKKHAEPVEEAKRLIKSKRILYVDEQERIRKAEEARLQAEARRLAEERALAEAIAAEAGGQSTQADEILSEPISVPVITMPNTTPKAGVSGAIREIWSAEVVSLQDLCRAVADGKVSIGYIEPNLQALNSMARSLKANMQVPGVRAVSRKV